MPTQGHLSGSQRASFHDPLLDGTHLGGLWQTCPLWEHLHNPNILFVIEENWQSYDAAATDGDYTLTQSVTGAAAISTTTPGVLELDSNSTTATQGANLQRLKACIIPAAGKHIWAEFKVKVVDTFDKVEMFVGLSASDTAIIASGVLHSDNNIGWYCDTDNGVLLFSGEKAGVPAAKAAATIAEDTWIRLGFYVDGVTSIQQYINGVAVAGGTIPTANIPIVAVYPSFVCQSAGTNDPIMHIGPYRIAQLR